MLMSEKSNIKDFLVYYISERIIVFPIYEYLPIIANTIIRDFREWDLLDNGKKITQREKYFTYFLEKELQKILDTFVLLFQDLNVKIITVYTETSLPDEYSEFFEDKAKFSNSVKKLLKKKKMKYFRETKTSSLFKTTEGTFKNIKIGVPSGEDKEFLTKSLDK